LANRLSEQHKKKIILILLALSSLTSLVLLIFLEPVSRKNLENTGQIDSIIVNQFTQFNIFENQIDIHSIDIDSSFSRLLYKVDVPYKFSESLWHYQLKQKLTDFDIRTPAAVSLQKQKTTIHLLANNTVFRTIEFQEDTSAALQRLPVHMFIKFSKIPDKKIIEEIMRLGEPMPLAIPIQPILDFNNDYEYIYKMYPRIAYHWANNSQTNLNPWHDTAILMQKFKQLHNLDRNAQILAYRDVVATLSPDTRKKIAEMNIHFYDISDTILLTEQQGKYQFEQQLKLAMKRARNGDTPILLIKGGSKTVQWLHSLLPEYRQSGLFIRVPRPLNL